MYQQGFGLEKNLEQALYWFRKGADQGDATAQFYVGAMYLYGTGTTKEYAQAMLWNRKAVDQDLPELNSTLAACTLIAGVCPRSTRRLVAGTI
jgi:TPR repeat protein